MSKADQRLRRKLKPVTEQIEALGVRVLDAQWTGGSHIRLTLGVGERTGMFFLGGTPSCKRARRNFISTVRQWRTQQEQT